MFLSKSETPVGKVCWLGKVIKKKQFNLLTLLWVNGANSWLGPRLWRQEWREWVSVWAKALGYDKTLEHDGTLGYDGALASLNQVLIYKDQNQLWPQKKRLCHYSLICVWMLLCSESESICRWSVCVCVCFHNFHNMLVQVNVFQADVTSPNTCWNEEQKLKWKSMIQLSGLHTTVLPITQGFTEDKDQSEFTWTQFNRAILEFELVLTQAGRGEFSFDDEEQSAMHCKLEIW